MKAIALLIPFMALLAGCAHDRFAITSDARRISERHPFVVDVTCTSASHRLYKTLRDEFHMLAMPPRIRLTAEFRIDHVIKGDVASSSFRITDARDRATPFCISGFWFQTNTSYRVGFDRITDGEVRGLEILAERKRPPNQSAAARSSERALQ